MIKAPLFKPHTFQEHPLNTRLWATNIFAISTARKSENVTESITTGPKYLKTRIQAGKMRKEGKRFKIYVSFN